MSDALEPIKVVAAVIQQELDLPDGQVMLWNQKYDIPETPGLYVVLSYIAGTVIGNNNRSVDTPEGMSEVQELVMRYVFQIDAMSFDNSARLRKEEIIMALRSQRCEQAQTDNNMQVARIPSGFADASSLEETARLNRFTLTVAVTALKRKTQAIDYYDTFAQPEVFVNP